MAVLQRLSGMAIGIAVVLSPAAAMAQAGTADLSRALKLDQIIAVMREEGLDYANDLDEQMLETSEVDIWARHVERIYDPDRMQTTVEAALAEEMTPDQIGQVVGYFTDGAGARALDLELSARVAMADPDIEAFARSVFHDESEKETPRLLALRDFVAVNDLVELNVYGALSATYHFYRGLREGGALSISDDAILEEVYSQEPDTRDETTEWLYAFLLMAYGPLTDAELDDYTRFSESEAGQALNAGLFRGFDDMYRDISYALGVEIAALMGASDL